MTGSILLFGCLAGLDNLQVCSSLGLVRLARRRIYLLAALFCLCELTAPLIGVLLGTAVLDWAGVRAHFVAPAVMIVCSLAIFISAVTQTGEHVYKSASFALPVSLSLDNVIAGAGISSLAAPVWPAAVSIGLTGALMSCIGLFGGHQLRRFSKGIPLGRFEFAAAAYLLVLAFRMLATKSI
jgi:manganese efflux pump family protein